MEDGGVGYRSAGSAILNTEQDMSGILQLFTGTVKESVSAFVIAVEKPSRASTDSDRLCSNASLSRLWNHALGAEKKSLTESLNLLVDKIWLDQECRRRLAYISLITDSQTKRVAQTRALV